MFEIKISLSSFRLCRRKTKSPATTYFFSPVNPKAREITYPIIPSPPPTTPTNFQQQYSTETTVGSEEDEILVSKDKKTVSNKTTGRDEEPDDSSGNKEDYMLSLSDSGAQRKVMKETLTVVLWSEHPYDDFKTSMLEMILEKKMFESKDLEQLLQCFLTLNHRNHHAEIVAAFTEIWELLFPRV